MKIERWQQLSRMRHGGRDERVTGRATARAKNARGPQDEHEQERPAATRAGSPLEAALRALPEFDELRGMMVEDPRNLTAVLQRIAARDAALLPMINARRTEFAHIMATGHAPPSNFCNSIHTFVQDYITDQPHKEEEAAAKPQGPSALEVSLRAVPGFDDLQRLIHENMDNLPEVLKKIADHNASLLPVINANRAEFVRVMAGEHKKHGKKKSRHKGKRKHKKRRGKMRRTTTVDTAGLSGEELEAALAAQKAGRRKHKHHRRKGSKLHGSKLKRKGTQHAINSKRTGLGPAVSQHRVAVNTAWAAIGLNEDGEGELDFATFLHVCDPDGKHDEGEIKNLFALLDEDKGGTIAMDEIVHALRTNEQAKELAQHYDSLHDIVQLACVRKRRRMSQAKRAELKRKKTMTKDKIKAAAAFGAAAKSHE